MSTPGFASTPAAKEVRRWCAKTVIPVLHVLVNKLQLQEEERKKLRSESLVSPVMLTCGLLQHACLEFCNT